MNLKRDKWQVTGGKNREFGNLVTHHSSLVTRSAFTLIEILLAVAIFMMALGAIYSMWFLIVRATQVDKETAAQMQRQRIAIRMIEDSLTSIQSYQASMQYYSF